MNLGMMILLVGVLIQTARCDEGEGETEGSLIRAPSQSTDLQRELDQYSDYHKGNNRYGEVRSILDQLRRTSMSGEPEAAQRLAPSLGAEAEDPEDDTELARNRRLASDLFEGDIVLTVDQAEDILTEAQAANSGRPPQRRKRKVVRKGSLWPSTTIYFTVDRSISSSRRSVIQAGIKAWEDNTCIRFREGKGRGDYITFMKGGGCYSHIGRSGGQQGVSIGDGCEAVGIAAHEIAHALGFWHEQNRYDRANYIRIETQNIYGGALMNFMLISSKMMQDFGVPYDLGSVMHYGAKAFSTSRSQPSIRTIDPSYQNTIGQRQRLSFIDVKQMNMAYCGGICKNQLRCQHNGYPDPSANGARCNHCRCPLGFGGQLCESTDDSDEGCGGVKSATSRWQTIRVGTPARRCSWLLKAPRGNRVIVEITRLNLKCRESCTSFLEIKRGPNFDQTGYRFCCPAQPWTKGIKSAATELSVIYRGEGGGSAEFRFRSDGSSSSSGGRAQSDGGWSEWGAWSECSVSCGGCGISSRRRECSGGPCGTGLTVQRRSCGESACAHPISASRVASSPIDSMCRSDDGGGRRPGFYMCARNNPNFVRALRPEESKRGVLSNEWNQHAPARDSTTHSGSCCDGYKLSGDACVRRAPRPD